MSKVRAGCPCDVTDEEWAFVLPYLLLCREDSRQREHDLREVFNGLRYIAKTGCQWRWMPHDLPPWAAVYQQTRRWMAADCFEALVADVQSVLREWKGRKGQPTAVCLDSRTLQSTPESGARAGYDGAKRRKGSKVHIAVDTLGHLLALTVTPASEGDRTQVAALAKQVQEVTGNTVELAYVDQGYTGPNAADAAERHGIQLEVVKHPMAKRGFVLLPKRWVVERSFAWAARFRRLARDYERLDTTLRGLHYVALRHPHVSKTPHIHTHNFITASSISVAHYGEQNGDLMRDPEMCFELRNGELDGYYYRNDYVGVEQWSRNNLDAKYVQLALLHAQHQRFAKIWDTNLRSQGFVEAYERQLAEGL